jgi:capsular polysaccharide export protein
LVYKLFFRVKQVGEILLIFQQVIECEVGRASFAIPPANTVFAWGRKPSVKWAALRAALLGKTLLHTEDGFLRSYQPGAAYPALSWVLDEQGVHYDCTRPSQLETLLNSSHDLVVPQQEEVLQFLLQHRLSKYNHAPPLDAGLLRGYAPRNDRHGERSEAILVIDQTFGDLSVTYGAATPQTFHDMLQAALADNHNATVYVKTHPQTTAGHKRGYLTHLAPHPRVVLLTQATNPMHLLSHMDKVYVVTSTMGFEALLMGKPVVCFGVPWYAGWGATIDRCTDSPAAPRRTRKRSVTELFAAAYLHYAHYLNPITHERGTAMDVMTWLVLQQHTATQLHGQPLNQRLVFMGMRRWKRLHMQRFFGLHPELLAFDVPLQAGDQAVHWGVDAPNSAWRVEDGFVRSVGLGSDLIPPMSLVLDKRGMYFDPTRPSDLEHLLQHHSFKPDELQEARAVRKYIVSFGITKYNLEPLIPVVWQSGGRQVLVVVGQVEDDASIRLGCTFVKTNLGLLQAVRHANPKAFIVYKPHPDVATGNRAGHLSLQQALQWADHVETHASVVSCIHACNELHTMTSLSGFDALLRGKPVTTYGLPFYAGWGLTTDLAGQGGDEPTCFARRTRRLSLDELVAGTLLRYPLYWDHQLKGVTNCMAVLRRIQTQRDTLLAEGVLQHLKDGYVRRLFRKLKHLLR